MATRRDFMDRTAQMQDEQRIQENLSKQQAQENLSSQTGQESAYQTTGRPSIPLSQTPDTGGWDTSTPPPTLDPSRGEYPNLPPMPMPEPPPPIPPTGAGVGMPVPPELFPVEPYTPGNVPLPPQEQQLYQPPRQIAERQAAGRLKAKRRGMPGSLPPGIARQQGSDRGVDIMGNLMKMLQRRGLG